MRRLGDVIHKNIRIVYVHEEGRTILSEVEDEDQGDQPHIFGREGEEEIEDKTYRMFEYVMY